MYSRSLNQIHCWIALAFKGVYVGLWSGQHSTEFSMLVLHALEVFRGRNTMGAISNDFALVSIC